MAKADMAVGIPFRPLRWWIYTPEQEEAFLQEVAARPNPQVIGRVWLGCDGETIYWSCAECMEALWTRKPGWQDIEPGGCAATLADGNDYVQAHHRGDSCIARKRRG